MARSQAFTSSNATSADGVVRHFGYVCRNRPVDGRSDSITDDYLVIWIAVELTRIAAIDNLKKKKVRVKRCIVLQNNQTKRFYLAAENSYRSRNSGRESWTFSGLYRRHNCWLHSRHQCGRCTWRRCGWLRGSHGGVNERRLRYCR